MNTKKVENYLKDLGKGYQNLPQTCPTTEELFGYFYQTLRPLELKRIRDHLLYCNACNRELISLEEAERKLHHKPCRSSIKELLHRILVLKPVKIATLAGAGITLLLLVSLLIKPIDHGPKEFRTRSTDMIVIIGITDMKPAGSIDEVTGFSWTADKRATSYSLRLFNDNFDLIWELDGIKEPTVSPPDNVTFLRQKDYTWHLIAYQENSKIAESTATFSIN